jgi:hypothetical protein
VFTAGGVLPHIHADPRHQLPRVRKAFDVADLDNHGQRKEVLDAFVAGQRLHGFLVLRRDRQLFDVLAVLRQHLVQIPDLAEQQGQVDAQAAGRSLDGASQPGIVGLGPVALEAGLGFVM